MKNILEAAGWFLFISACLAAVIAVLCTIGGAVTFILALTNVCFVKVFAYFAIGYFVSLILIVVIYLLVCGYYAIEKAVKK